MSVMGRFPVDDTCDHAAAVAEQLRGVLLVRRLEGREDDFAWMRRAACADLDPDIFFPRRGSGVAAKAICARCRVRLQCLHHSLANDEQQGIWGGLTEHERRAYVRRLGSLNGSAVHESAVEQS